MSDAEYDTEPVVTYGRRGSVGVVTLNRPKVMNAVNSALSSAAGAALEQAAEDPTVHVVVITGAGPAFCAGADLKELARNHRIDDPDHSHWGFAGIVRHWIDKPTIAAINGYALGGGTEIALACDLAVIDEAAKLGLPEVKRGIFAAAGGVIRLQRQIPMKVALEITLTGDPISAARAYELGLVNQVAPRGTAVDVAMELAERIARNGPLAVRHSKRVIHRTAAAGSDWESEVWRINRESAKVVFGSRDAREGARAFTEKRPPQWEAR
ncbi:crotonase/enoyl-CoA hydratase family protein [Mycolicibacterium sp. ELW1]|uniref:crotonase/enoyl-CoA hydratase family protein n=1 Tax=Mycobacteriaceae TaxID=1762 RepID=UPI0011EF6BA1|nr:crotonase/enoyl-CoA hydratase family protein [Mycobacterium sp. ELW1]QEN12968.1 crotonase/enoyl-CoA hydratase family protein [Mycobacterium sp. ELW1]